MLQMHDNSNNNICLLINCFAVKTELYNCSYVMNNLHINILTYKNVLNTQYINLYLHKLQYRGLNLDNYIYLMVIKLLKRSVKVFTVPLLFGLRKK